MSRWIVKKWLHGSFASRWRRQNQVMCLVSEPIERKGLGQKASGTNVLSEQCFRVGQVLHSKTWNSRFKSSDSGGLKFKHQDRIKQVFSAFNIFSHTHSRTLSQIDDCFSLHFFLQNTSTTKNNKYQDKQRNDIVYLNHMIPASEAVSSTLALKRSTLCRPRFRLSTGKKQSSSASFTWSRGRPETVSFQLSKYHKGNLYFLLFKYLYFFFCSAKHWNTISTSVPVQCLSHSAFDFCDSSWEFLERPHRAEWRPTECSRLHSSQAWGK